MRTLSAALVIALDAGAAPAEIRSLETCRAEVVSAPEATREAAARWITLGGGTPARLCEIAALQALGAERAAATNLTELAQSPRAALSAPARALLFSDAATLWYGLGQTVLARKTLDAADALDPGATHSLKTRISLEMEAGNWAAAEAALTRLLAAEPSAGLYRLRARALREQGDLAAALADLAKTPETAETRLERASVWAAEGKREAAQIVLLALMAEETDPRVSREAGILLETLAREVRATPQPEGVTSGPGPRPRPAETAPAVIRPRPRP